MQKILSSRLFWGLVLIIGGGLLLLNTFGLIAIADLIWAIILGIGGILFLGVYISNHDHWWALIPGVILIAISATIWLDKYYANIRNSDLISTIILGGIALSFFLVYLADRGNWWAIIPAGVMSTIAVVARANISQSGVTSGGIFFLGLALTFALAAILPNKIGPMRWAWIPAGILGLIGLVILLSRPDLINYIWPFALILGGALLIIRAIVRK
jgi:hypothetical protein